MITLVSEMVGEAQAHQIVLKAAKEVDVIIAIIKQAMFHGVTVGLSIRPFLTCAAIPEKELLIAGLKKGLINLDDGEMTHCVGEYSIADAFFVLATKACYPLPQTLEELLSFTSNVSEMVKFEAFCNLVEPDEETSIAMATSLSNKKMMGEALFILNTHLKSSKSPEVTILEDTVKGKW
ncbi:hypothetical protein SELMODRAFT_416451 [Selaginella moellendorffii]|uniref:Uncharacterized protein n=1 Tax=Selaginella moellendorffii TaxID=88036 RepID=D8RZB2_SELML|nr:uncharacterized protein LOC9648646 [Selaginella moellendorffii]XP_024537164.1 uncharacterized protein LOC9648646 [Selaginella moellendorffii]EFJ22714.1 hypothetical protein SELMODRAFT_416451 [Selaginella moellendorffii]|eukprot:XP_002976454.1 uncharacterized protein LOC9648646 [Selaginella moellendorffii]